jgi:prepilin-type N-terminal cleavage/methylation domain-containing protein
VLIALRQRGFTLVEIMLSICMTSMVSAAVYQLLVTTQRLSRFQAEQVSAQSVLRVGALVVTNELRELSPVDLLSRGPGSLTYRAMRGLGFLCQTASATQLRIARNHFSGFRDPQPGRDSLYLFLEGAPETSGDDTWLSLPIVEVSSAPCPGTENPGLALTVPSTAAIAGAVLGTPVRVYEVMELRLYQSDGSSWLGARSITAGEFIQPIVGPLADRDGFQLDYLDGENRPAAGGGNVRSVRAALRSSVEPELTAQVALRNASSP